MINVNPNNRPNIYEILRDSFTNNMTYAQIKDEAEHLDPEFKGICRLKILTFQIKHKLNSL